MAMDVHQGILALLVARPELVIALWRQVEPDSAKREDGEWVVRVCDPNLRVRTFSGNDRHLRADLIFTLHPADDPDGPAAFVLILECQLSIDADKQYAWAEYLAAARRVHKASGRVLVLSPIDKIIGWAHTLFDDEPWLRPRLIGRELMPIIDDHGRALREPELAVLSAIFHGRSEHGSAVVSAAGLALQSLPRAKRREYVMLLEDAIPEELMGEIRKVTEDEAREAVDEWFRVVGTYRAGHREGLEQGIEQGIEQGREQGLLRGLQQALALVLELRGLVPSDVERARIDDCQDPATLERWCRRAKTASAVSELFDPP